MGKVTKADGRVYEALERFQQRAGTKRGERFEARLADIARELGISTVSVDIALHRLARSGVIVQDGHGPGGAGLTLTPNVDQGGGLSIRRLDTYRVRAE